MGNVNPKRPTTHVARSKRRRRTADEARLEILMAAEAQFVASGPDSIRLQDIATVVGISHPAVLHHFGSREELVRTVVERAIEDLQSELIQTITRASGAPNVGEMGIVAAVSKLLREQRYARLFGWLLLSGHDPLLAPTPRENWTRIVDAMHALRPNPAAKIEDTRFAVALLSFALLGEALAGGSIFGASGYEAADPAPGQRFRDWLSVLLRDHLNRQESQVTAIDNIVSTGQRSVVQVEPQEPPPSSHVEDDSLQLRLREVIEASLPNADASVNHVAAKLNLSARTLQRRLQERRTTFFDELERVRQRLAERYLTEGNMNVSQSSLALGFSDLKSFERAFHRWFGCSPREWRKRIGYVRKANRDSTRSLA